MTTDGKINVTLLKITGNEIFATPTYPQTITSKVDDWTLGNTEHCKTSVAFKQRFILTELHLLQKNNTIFKTQRTWIASPVCLHDIRLHLHVCRTERNTTK
jgi:hypothetical protein